MILLIPVKSMSPTDCRYLIIYHANIFFVNQTNTRSFCLCCRLKKSIFSRKLFLYFFNCRQASLVFFWQSQIKIGDSLSRPFIQVRIQKVQKYISGPVIFKVFFDIKQCLVLVPLAFTQNGVLVSPRDVKYDFLPQIVDKLLTI